MQSWLDIQGDIADMTGVDMGGKDTLRQFVAGTRFIDNAQRRRAIVQFLTHEEVDALSLDEFLAPGSPYHAPRRLIDYLESGQDVPDAEHPLHRLCGSYRAEHRGPDELVRVTLLLSEIDHAKILRVDETHEIYSFTGAGSSRRATAADGMLRARKESRGWCIMTPEDNILFFMKESKFGANHYYHLLSDLNIWTPEPEESFALLRHDHPEIIEFDDAQASKKADIHLRSIEKSIIIFSKL